MTYIEFFTKTATENICACLANVPDRVVMVGYNNLMELHAERYKKILAERGHGDVEFVCRWVDSGDLQAIVRELCDIINEYPDSILDLTGGEELYLVAAGIVRERYKNIKMHYFDIADNKVHDCDGDGRTILDGKPMHIGISESIRLHGGDIIYSDDRPDGTYEWDMTNEFCRDIESMWEICRNDVKKWNIQTGVFAAAEILTGSDASTLCVSASVSQITDYLRRFNSHFVILKEITERLYRLGLVIEYYHRGDSFFIKYKNEQVKRCLTKAGMALEMKIYLTALGMHDKDGKRSFCDVMNGVCIDWDGKIPAPDDTVNVENEIDVMMMRGLVPTFVSCKNGFVQIEELYKLSTVAEQFGRRYARRALVATSLDVESEFGRYFCERAERMGVVLITGVQDMTDEQIQEAIFKIYDGKPTFCLEKAKNM